MAAPPPSYGREEMLMQQFRSIAQRYEISDEFAMKLKQLEGWEIVLILDDSGSMNTPITNGQPSGPFARSITRWDELKTTAGIIVDMGAVMDKDGLDLYFLNRATVLNVTSSQQVEPLFQQPPNGLTPITPVLQHVLEAKKQIAVEKKILIIIATDGVPTNQQGHSDIPGLKNVLMHQRDASRFYVTFLACTDDEAVMAYLNEMDKKIQHLDVVDDYQSERREILKARGSKYPFSFGDYIVKTLLGSIDPTFDRLDEPQGCCSLQ